MNTKRIIEKLETLEDEELKGLILDLLNEREALVVDAQKDDLTGAYNRRILSNLHITHGSLAILDLDDFKMMNDRYGHDYGDKVLKDFVKIINSSIRSDDIVIRYGGDEFVVIFNGCPLNIAENRLFSVQKKLDNYTFSSGVVEYDENSLIEKVLEEADSILYKYKGQGKGRINIKTKE